MKIIILDFILDAIISTFKLYYLQYLHGFRHIILICYIDERQLIQKNF